MADAFKIFDVKRAAEAFSEHHVIFPFKDIGGEGYEKIWNEVKNHNKKSKKYKSEKQNDLFWFHMAANYV